jgi:hypothetical protein
MTIKSVAGSLAAYALKKSTVIHIPSLNVYIVDDGKLQEQYANSDYKTFEDFLKSNYPEYWKHYNETSSK